MEQDKENSPLSHNKVTPSPLFGRSPLKSPAKRRRLPSPLTRYLVDSTESRVTTSDSDLPEILSRSKAARLELQQLRASLQREQKASRRTLRKIDYKQREAQLYGDFVDCKVKECEELREATQIQLQRIEALELELNAAHEEISSLQTQLASSQEDTSSLETALRDSEEQRSEIIKALEEVQNELESVSAKLHEREAEIIGLVASNEHLKQLRHKAEADVVDMQTALRQAEARFQRQAEADIAGAEIALQGEIELLRGALEASYRNAAYLQQRVDELQEQLTTLQEEHRAELDEFDQEINEWEDELKHTQERLRICENERDTLACRLEASAAEVASLRQEMVQLTEQANRLAATAAEITPNPPFSLRAADSEKSLDDYDTALLEQAEHTEKITTKDACTSPMFGRTHPLADPISPIATETLEDLLKPLGDAETDTTRLQRAVLLAAREHNWKVVWRLCAIGADINCGATLEHPGETALFHACAQGNLGAVRRLLSMPEADGAVQIEPLPIHAAVANDRATVVKEFMRRNVCTEKQCGELLRLALQHRSRAVVKLLVKRMKRLKLRGGVRGVVQRIDLEGVWAVEFADPKGLVPVDKALAKLVTQLS